MAKPDFHVRQAWRERFNLHPNGNGKKEILTNAVMHQLSCCKSDECRRLILGINPTGYFYDPKRPKPCAHIGKQSKPSVGLIRKEVA